MGHGVSNAIRYRAGSIPPPCAGFAESIAWMLAYELTPDCDDLFSQQQTLG